MEKHDVFGITPWQALRQARALKKRQDKKRRQREKKQREAAARMHETVDRRDIPHDDVRQQ